MSQENFKHYYVTPAKLIKQALDITEQLFCHPRYNPTGLNPCTNHNPPRTLKKHHIIIDHNVEPRTREIPIYPPISPHSPQPKSTFNIKNNPIRYLSIQYSITKKSKQKINIKSPKNTKPFYVNGIYPTT